MRGLLMNLIISVLMGFAIGLCGGLFHNCVHFMQVVFRAHFGGGLADLLGFEQDETFIKNSPRPSG